ncbi:MAG: RNA polymerase sigma factor [bacterium]
MTALDALPRTENAGVNGSDDLIHRVAAGDEPAFARFVSLYTAPVYRFLRRMVNSSEDAEDLTQETFYAVYKHRHTLRPDAEVLPYLYTIARRKAVSLFRWRSVRQVLMPLSDSHANLPADTESPVHALQQSRQEEVVNRALAALPSTQRAALILRFFEGLTYPDIAEVLQKPEGTVKSLVFRGEKELRRGLQDMGLMEERGGR